MPGVRSRRFGIVGIIQRLMAQILRLDFHLECLDYRMANWYHADLDYHTFKLMKSNSEHQYHNAWRGKWIKQTLGL